MNKRQKLDVMVLRAQMKAEETLAKFQEEWHGEEPQMPEEVAEGEIPMPQIEEGK